MLTFRRVMAIVNVINFLVLLNTLTIGCVPVSVPIYLSRRSVLTGLAPDSNDRRRPQHAADYFCLHNDGLAPCTSSPEGST